MAKRKKNGSDSSERPRRPELPRSEPIRSWQGIFGSAPNGMPSFPGLPATGPAAEAVQRGVETGYRIMQDSLREGAKVASSFMNPARSGGASGPEVPQIFTRLFQNAADLNATWLDMFNTMTGMNGQRTASSTPDATHASAPQAASATSPRERSKIALSVDSTRPTEIILTLDDDSSERFAVENLRRRGSKDALSDVKVEPPSEPGGSLRIRVRVPAEVSAGRYTGAILNASTKQPAGRVTVVVGGTQNGE